MQRKNPGPSGRRHLPRNPRGRHDAAFEPLEGRRLFTSVVVNSTADVDAPGTVTLRDAIATANASASPTTITFDAAVFGTAQTVTLTGGQLELSNTAEPTTVAGPAAGVTVSGNGASRAFAVDAGVTASLSGVSVTDGRSGGAGGGISNAGTLSFADATISGCTAPAGSAGGGLYNAGVATLTGTLISGNAVDDIATQPYYPDGEGGGIFNLGTMTVRGGTVTGNTAGKGGGGIFNSGTISVTGTTISGNASATAYGGGFNNNPATLTGGATATLTDVTVSGNSTAGNDGGGICSINLTGNGAPTRLTLVDVTVAGNSAAEGGGGVYLDGSNAGSSLTGVTIAGNTTPADGGGLLDGAGSGATVANTILAGNSAGGSGPDASGSVDSLGHNLVGVTDGSSGWTASDRTGSAAAPLSADLGSLAGNGGPTQTLLPLAGSPAIGAGSVTLIPAGVTTDQRGDPRTVNGAVDIGAVEVGGAAPVASVTALAAPATTLVVGLADAFAVAVGPATGSGATPTGSVSLFEDGVAEGTFPLVNGSATATFTADVAGSGRSVTAVYSGDGTYAASTSSVVTQAFLPASTATATITGTVAPAAGIAGQRFAARVPVRVTNAGPALSGTFTLNLYLDVPAVGLDAAPVPIATLARRTTLKAGRSFSATLSAKALPAALAAGTYHFTVLMTDPVGDASLPTSTRTVAVATPVVTLGVGSAAYKPSSFAGKPLSYTFTVTVTNTGNVAGVGTITITDDPYNDAAPLGTLAPTTETLKANLKPGKSQRFVVRRRYAAGAFPAGTFNDGVTVSMAGAASATALVLDAFTVN